MVPTQPVTWPVPARAGYAAVSELGDASTTATTLQEALQALENNVSAHSPLLQIIEAPRLSRTVATATETWMEWNSGLLNAPPFKTIYAPDHKFRSDESTEKKFWYRRRPLITKIEELSKSRNQSPLVIAQTMDGWLDSKQKTLRALADAIAKGEMYTLLELNSSHLIPLPSCDACAL